MSGLLLKDLLTIGKQMKLYLVILVVFALMPGMSMPAFAVVLAAMLPITAQAYDERAKWKELAAMMPYSPTALVLSKYLLGALLTGGVTLLSLLVGEAPMVAAAQLCIALLLMSVCLCMTLWLGVEKGRIAMLLSVVVVTLGGAGLEEHLLLDSFTHQLGWLGWLAALTAGVGLVSILLAIRLSNRRA